MDHGLIINPLKRKSFVEMDIFYKAHVVVSYGFFMDSGQLSLGWS
jgi:hypothetical protein